MHRDRPSEEVPEEEEEEQEETEAVAMALSVVLTVAVGVAQPDVTCVASRERPAQGRQRVDN